MKERDFNKWLVGDKQEILVMEITDSECSYRTPFELDMESRIIRDLELILDLYGCIDSGLI